MYAKNTNNSNFHHTRRKLAVWGTNAGVSGRGKGLATTFKQKRGNKRFDARRPNTWDVAIPTTLPVGESIAAPPVNRREGEEGYDMHRRHKGEEFYSSDARMQRRSDQFRARTRTRQELRNRVQYVARAEVRPNKRDGEEVPRVPDSPVKRHKRQQGAYVRGGLRGFHSDL